MLYLMMLAFLDDPVLLVLIHCLYEAFYAKHFLIFNFFKNSVRRGKRKMDSILFESLSSKGATMTKINDQFEIIFFF